MQNLFPVGLNQTVSLDHNVSLGNCSYPLSQLATRLDALLLVLKTCKGAVCYDPWSTLLPNTGVSTLVAAMDQQFDEFFAGIPRVEYDHCEAGYLLEAEGPVWEDGLSTEFVDVQTLVRRSRGTALNRV